MSLKWKLLWSDDISIELFCCQLLNKSQTIEWIKFNIFPHNCYKYFYNRKFFRDYSGTGGSPEHWRKLGIDWFFVRTMCRVRPGRVRGGKGGKIWKFTRQITKCKWIWLFRNLEAGSFWWKSMASNKISCSEMLLILI